MSILQEGLNAEELVYDKV